MKLPCHNSDKFDSQIISRISTGIFAIKLQQREVQLEVPLNSIYDECLLRLSLTCK